ncbi:MAG: thioesterase family protein [Solirubrobacterales bacterium]
MSDSIFTPSMDGSFTPGEHARGPWDPQALHGGAPAALITAAFERMEPGSELPIARLGFEFLKPIPFAPLKLTARMVRAGKRVQELAAELHAADQLICRASALRVQATPDDLPPGTLSPQDVMPGPELGKEVKFALNPDAGTSFASTAMQMRWLTDPWALGPGKVWMRLRHPLVPGEPLTPLIRLLATADFGNGVSAALPFEEYLFINADLTIHLWRRPQGEWIGLDARTLLHGGGTGLAESVLHDSAGPVGRAFQTLVVQAR